MTRKRLGQAHKLLGFRVSRDAWKSCDGDTEKFESIVRTDKRTVAIDPALIILFIQLAMALFQYWKNRQPSTASEADFDDENAQIAILGSVRYR